MAMSGGAKSFTLDWPVAMLAAASMWRAADGNSLTSGTSSLLREAFHQGAAITQFFGRP